MCLPKVELCSRCLPMCLSPCTALCVLCDHKQGGAGASRAPGVQLPALRPLPCGQFLSVFSSAKWE